MTIPSRLAASAVLAAVLIHSPALPCRGAPQPETTVKLEEITVTARKRQESLSRVPLSIVALGDTRLTDAGIEGIGDTAVNIPNLAAGETATGNRLSIRGIASGNNQAFEQSVGQFVDGIHYARQPLIRVPFLDLERLEVLRGPQPVLFGKSTIAGALNLVSARPGARGEAEWRALVEPATGRREAAAVVSGAPVPDFGARLAWRGARGDGHVTNTHTGDPEPGDREDSLRLTLAWPPEETPGLMLKLARHDLRAAGRAVEVVRDEPNLLAPGASPLAGLDFRGILDVLGQPPMEAERNLRRQANTGEFGRTLVDNATMTLRRDIGSATVTLISGLLDYTLDERCDCDFTPARIFTLDQHESFRQFSQEVRLASAPGGRLDWLAGAYYHHTDLATREKFMAGRDGFFHRLAAAIPSLKSLAALPGTAALRRNRQEGRNRALFFQATWHASDKLRLSLGGRYTRQDKRAGRSIDIIGTATGRPVKDSPAPRVYLRALGVHSEQVAGVRPAGGPRLPGHDLRGERREDRFTPQVALQWHPAGKFMLYGTAATGFKAGGFDARANTPASFEFGAERARSFEFGFKGRPDGGAIDISAFVTDYRDLQISQFDGTLGFNVGNAASTRVRGLEIGGRWSAPAGLVLGYAYAWLDFTFTEFNNGTCPVRREPDWITEEGVPLCDFTGRTGLYAPAHGLNLSLDHMHPLGGGLDLISHLSVNYQTEQNIHDSLDPRFITDQSVQIRFKAGLAGEHWRLSLVGQNLGGEHRLTYAGNVPLADALFGTNTYYAFTGRPRRLALEVGYQF